MAKFTIQFSVADEHLERIHYALRKHFGQVTDDGIDPATGQPIKYSRDMTPEELLQRVRKMSMDNIKSIVMSVEVEEAAKKARDSIKAVVIE